MLMASTRIAMSSTTIQSEYERYLRVPELLSLQKPPEERSHDDELLFQIVHQVEELWFKLALDDGRRAISAMDDDEDHEAVFYLRRIRELETLMTAQLFIIEKMPPANYWEVRKGLGHGSGQESPGYNAMLRAFSPIWEAFARLLSRRELDVVGIHRDPKRDGGAFAIAEALLEIDAGFQAFRYHHWILVKRIIGEGTPSLKGKPAELLERSMKTAFYPELWKARETLFEDFTPGELKV